MTRIRILANALVALALSACGDQLAPPSVTVTAVTVAPSSVVLSVGRQVPLTATVVGASQASDNRVRWTSANPAVAAVDANGVVAALGGGSTTITATSLANPLASGSCAVTVAPYGTGDISITAINQDGKPADLSNTFGRIDVLVNVDLGAPGVSRVDLLLSRPGGDTVLASSAPSGGSSGIPTTLSFSTAGLSNGQYAIKARVMLQSGTAVVSASVQLTIRNP